MADPFGGITEAIFDGLGIDAIYRRAGEADTPVRVIVERNAEYASNFGQVLQYRTRVDVVRSALPFRPADGDLVELVADVETGVAAEIFEVEKVAAGGDDGHAYQILIKP
jgi:hypothetical protein